MCRLFLLSVLFCLVSAPIAEANQGVDAVFEKYNTYANNEHLNKDYTYVQTIEYENKKAFVIEYENPQEKDPRYLRYIFTNNEGEFLYEISLGSYDATTQIDIEMGNTPVGQRLYHLDVYCPSQANDKGISKWGTHSTLGFFSKLPDFKSLTETVASKEKTANRCGQKASN